MHRELEGGKMGNKLGATGVKSLCVRGARRRLGSIRGTERPENSICRDQVTKVHTGPLKKFGSSF